MDILEEIVFPTIDDARRTIESASILSREAECPLFGDRGLDSLGLVQFIIMVEERIQAQARVPITLASERALSQKSSPFRTLGTLAAFIEECLADAHR